VVNVVLIILEQVVILLF